MKVTYKTHLQYWAIANVGNRGDGSGAGIFEYLNRFLCVFLGEIMLVETEEAAINCLRLKKHFSDGPLRHTCECNRDTEVCLLL